MTTIRAFRAVVPLALAAVVGLFGAALAQESPPAKKSKAAAKSTKSESAKSENGEAKPAAKGKSAPPAPGGGQPTWLGQFGDWGAYTANNNGRTVCYALAKPTSQATQPPNKPRDPAYIFVSTRPAEKVKDEVSLIIGYPFKPNSEATVEIAGTKFALYTQADGAWIKNAAEEARMVEAMRKGADMIVAGESGKGTKSTDRYTLKGLGQALDRVAQECK